MVVVIGPASGHWPAWLRARDVVDGRSWPAMPLGALCTGREAARRRNEGRFRSGAQRCSVLGASSFCTSRGR
jgi:hypothetical protein